MSKRTLIIIALTVIVAVVGSLFYRHQSMARAARLEAEIVKGLTADEIRLVLENQAKADTASVTTIVASATTRRAFLDGLRQYLALAAQARREGFTEDPKFKLNFEYKKNLLLAGIYKVELGERLGKNYVVPDDEIKAVLSDPKSMTEFTNTMQAIRSIQEAALAERGSVSLAPKLEGDKLTEAQTAWARTKIVAAKAQGDQQFMQRPEIALRLKILEAGILSNDYLQKNWSRIIKASNQEIAAYLASHPELDVKKKLQKAEQLLSRIKAGEDFEKLAREFSEDRSTRDNGGLYQDVHKGFLWAQVEDATLKLENGQVADRLIESDAGYHIVKLVSKQSKKDKDGNETITFDVRHILLQKKFEEVNSKNPNVPPPFMAAEEIAKAQVEAMKRKRFVDGIIQQNSIQLPDDFNVHLAEAGSTGAPPDQARKSGS